MDTMCMMLGGIAEILFFGKQTQSTGTQVTGCPTATATTATSSLPHHHHRLHSHLPHRLPPQDDLQKVTRLAYDIVTNFGMSERWATARTRRPPTASSRRSGRTRGDRANR